MQTDLIEQLRQWGGCEINGPTCQGLHPDKPREWCRGCLMKGAEVRLRQLDNCVSTLADIVKVKNGQIDVLRGRLETSK